MRSIRFIVLSRFFAILLVFFAIFFLGSYFVLNNIIVQFMVRDNSSALSFVMNNIQKNYMTDLQALDDLAKTRGFNPYQRASAERLVDQLLNNNNVFSNVHVYDREGNLLFAKKRNAVAPYTIHKNFREQGNKEFVPTAESVILEGKSKTSPTFVTNSGQLFQTYVVPYFEGNNQKHTVGIISGGVFPDSQKIDHLVEGLQLAEGNFIVISDPHGHVLAQNGVKTEKERESLKPFLESANKKFATSSGPDRSQVFVESSTNLREYPYYFLSLPIPDLHLIVTLGVGTQHIERKREEVMYYLVLTMVIGLFLGLIGSYLVGSRLAEPLHEISLSVEKMSLGDFSHRIEYQKKDELGHLCFLINRLAIKLRKDRYLGELWVTRKEANELVKHKHPEV